MGYSIDALYVGQTASSAKTISETDVYLFAGITGDFNPMHVNEEFARQTQFKGRIVHGMLSVGLLSGLMAMQLPGPGSIYLGQEIKFLKPVRIGDTITSTVTVIEIRKEKKIAKLETVCTNQNGETVVTGVATTFIQSGTP